MLQVDGWKFSLIMATWLNKGLNLAKTIIRFFLFIFTKNTVISIEKLEKHPETLMDEQQHAWQSDVKRQDFEMVQIKQAEDGQDVIQKPLGGGHRNAFQNGHLERPEANTRPASQRPRHFDCLDGYRGFCALLVVIQHSVGHMKIANDYAVIFILGSYLGVYGFFVLSAFLLTYRFIKELDTKLDDYTKSASLVYEAVNQATDTETGLDSMSTSGRMRPRSTKSLFGSGTDQLKLFALTTVKYALRRFFRIYVSLLVFTHDPSNMMLQNGGKSHLWTMPTEIKYYFCIPVISLLAVKTKRFALLWFVLGLFLVLLNEKLQVLPFVDGFAQPAGGSLASYFTVFFSGSLVAIVYYFHFDSAQKSSRFLLPSCSCSVLKKLPVLVFLQKALTKPAVNVFWSVVSFSYYIILLKHYSWYWKDHALLTDQLFTWLEFKPYRLIDHVNAGVPSAFLLILMLLTAPTSFTNMFARSSVLNAYGKFSFGIYLGHIKVLAHVADVKAYFKSDGLEILLVECIFAYLYGFCFFYAVENPLMNTANLLSKKVEAFNCFKVK